MEPPEEDRPTRQCSSCGAIIDLPPEQVSGACSYCASQLVDAERGEQTFDRVAPFRIPKTAALDRLRQHLAKRFWAPDSLRKAASAGAVQARMRGVPVPFYAYDATCRSSYRARVGVHWHRTETFTDKEGKRQTKQVQETEWFPLDGTSVNELQGHIESASRGLTALEVLSLRGFDLGRALRFDRHLLAGWAAELPSEPRAVVDRRAVKHIELLEAARIQRKVLPGDTHRGVSVNTEVDLEGVSLVLLPLWITTYSHAGKVFRMLVHGQTGHCVGQAPVSRTKVVVAALLVAALGLLILYLTKVLR